jgi:hypothetical protein
MRFCNEEVNSSEMTDLVMLWMTENVDKEKHVEWLWSDLFDPVFQHVTDAADIVSTTMKQEW